MLSSFTKRLLWSLLLLPSILFAQEEASAVVFTTGGTFNAAGNLVELFSMHPDSSTPKMLFAEFGDFSNAVVADHRYAYAHIGRGSSHPSGKDVVIRYDLVKGEVVDSFNAGGVQRMAVNESYLVVTRGFGADSNYVLVFDKNDLAKGPVYQDQAIPVSTSALAVSKDRAYVSYNENGKGTIGAFSLNKGGIKYLNSFSLDTLAAGIGSLYFYGNGLVGNAEVVSFPPPNFTPVLVSKAIFRLDTATGTYSVDTSINRSNSSVGLVGDYLYGNYGGGIQGFDLNSMTASYTDTVFKGGITSGVFNRADSVFAFQETDYFSFGRVALVPYADPSMASTVSTPISGSAIAINYNNKPEAQLASFFNHPSDTFDLSSYFSDPDKDNVKVNWLETPASGPAFSILPDGKRILKTKPGPFAFRYSVIDDFGATDTNLVDIGISLGLQSDAPVFSLYPNPASESLVLNFTKNHFQFSINMLNLQGKQVFSKQYTQGDRVVLPVASLNPGMYIVEVRSEKGVSTSRFIKQ